MAVTRDKVAPYGGVGSKKLTKGITTAISQTALIVQMVQVTYGFLVEQVTLYASAVTDTLHAIVGIVRPGKTVQAVTMTIAATTTKFKLSAAFDGVMPARVLNESVQRVFHQAILDNIAFSSAFTINVAGAAVVTWGAVRVQRDYLGAITTKVVTQDQSYATEAEALYACNAQAPADEFQIDLGTITISMSASHTFTAGTTALTGGNIAAVNYNGVVAGFVNVCDADPQFVAATFVKADMTDIDSNRAVATGGGLLVIKYTTDGAGAGTNASVDVDYRPWPMNGEVATTAAA